LYDTIRTPRDAGSEHSRKGQYVVFHDHVGPPVGEDLLEPLVDVARAADQLLPDRKDQRLQLRERGLPELWRSLPGEVLPELPRSSSTSGFGFRRMTASSNP
jgi:hypothetical protein